MKKAALMVTTFAMLWFARTARATPTAQQNCDYTRITAWKVYFSCVVGVVAKDARGILFDEFAAFARCRHTYFRKWAGFQAKPSLAGSTCIGSRFTDNGDQTLTDNLTTLVWEKKDNLDGMPNYSDPHDANNGYAWGGYAENGDVYWGFLATLNSGSGFAGANGWRLPTIVELQTIVLDFACSGQGDGPRCACPSSPCIDPALDSGNTPTGPYWSSTSQLQAPFPVYAWIVDFLAGDVGRSQKTGGSHARAVRSGL